MENEKAQIFLDRVLDRINNGEFDEHLTIPFASRELLTLSVESAMQKKLDTDSTPVFSETDIYDLIAAVRETAVETAGAFIKIGLLVKDEDGQVSMPDKWKKFLGVK